MAFYLTAPTHYLNHCWLISIILWHSPEGNYTGTAQDIFPWYEFEKYCFKITAVSPRGQWVKIGKPLIGHPVLCNFVWTNVSSLTIKLLLSDDKPKLADLHLSGLYIHLEYVWPLMWPLYNAVPLKHGQFSCSQFSCDVLGVDCKLKV